MLPISNFGFLGVHESQLVELGSRAERYFRDDPCTAIFKLRQFAELLCKTIAAHQALYVGGRETFEETLRRLSYDP
jgi:type I restriction enzyme R subunit